LAYFVAFSRVVVDEDNGIESDIQFGRDGANVLGFGQPAERSSLFMHVMNHVAEFGNKTPTEEKPARFRRA